LIVDTCLVPDLTISKNKNAGFFGKALILDEVKCFFDGAVELCATEIGTKALDGFDSLLDDFIAVVPDACWIREVAELLVQLVAASKADDREAALGWHALHKQLESLSCHEYVFAAHGTTPVNDEDEMEIRAVDGQRLRHFIVHHKDTARLLLFLE